ncbi:MULTISPECIES: hypothetical protein [unclassified Streptomyces]|uniref:hypothetical protein n=1 Tax=unclassified Streptomyces TaxID=2593676 RepID=UPI000AC31A2D|nr:hypothetical protein [Streptomyces sp. CB02058]
MHRSTACGADCDRPSPYLEHLAITRKTVTGLADRLPAVAPDLPEHPDCPRILDAFNHATGPLRAKNACEALGHELLPKNVEGARAKLKRLVKLGILTEADTGNLARRPKPDTYVQQSPATTWRAYWSSGPMSATTF